MGGITESEQEEHDQDSEVFVHGSLGMPKANNQALPIRR